MSKQIVSLATSLASVDVAERIQAAEALSRMAEVPARAAPALLAALVDRDETVRNLVTSALENCGPPEQDQVDELEASLVNPNGDIAYWSATLLGRLGAGAIQAVESLKTAAAEHPSHEARKRATWALGKIASG